ncbi:MAG: winged helix-turn-helix transcriptional regulator, partial [Bacteroidales bacterium]|nr:winged helix-turn-helix transcriptional regulator [Bacteroidales bacterium]
VFKEALINALSHRDYFEKGASITIEVFDDRVEITNPGDLLPTVARNFGRRSMSRNPLIFGLFNKMRLVEHIGSGIPRMRKDMTEAGLPEPMFEDDGIFVVTLFRHTAKKETVPIATVPYTITDDSESFAVSENVEKELQPITDTQREIMFAMIRNPQITLPEIAAKVGLGRTTVYKLVKQLQERELVARRGRKSDGCWVVID